MRALRISEVDARDPNQALVVVVAGFDCAVYRVTERAVVTVHTVTLLLKVPAVAVTVGYCLCA